MVTPLLPSWGNLVCSIVSSSGECQRCRTNAASAMQEHDDILAEMFFLQAESAKNQARQLLGQLGHVLELEENESEAWAECFKTLANLADQEGFAQIGSMYKLLLV